MEGRGPPVLFKGERWNEKERMAREPTSCKIIKMKKEINVLTESYFETSQDFCRISTSAVGFLSTKKNLTWGLSHSIDLFHYLLVHRHQ